MRRPLPSACWVLLVATGIVRLAATARAAEPAAGEAPPDFARDIRPIFADHCYDCHGPAAHESGLRLNRRAAALAGGDSGQPAIVPGKPEESRLVKLIRGDGELRMPPADEAEPLSSEQIALLERWIAAGAAWPAEADVADDVPPHWAYTKPEVPPLPAVSNVAWPANEVDRFVLARLEHEGLAPAPEADRYTLIRRLSLDLRGLPPTLEESEAFVHDAAPDAYARLVEQFLGDPAYGERWARMWLDLARYADSKGYGSDPLRTIWGYRDWVIDAFNRNEPYDQFTIDQLAGDLVPGARPDQILATAFHRNTMANDEGGTDDEEFRVAAVKDRIDTTMQVWMGLSFGCAKCHSHKYDPITQREYYQFFAYFNQTEDADRPDEAPRATVATPIQERKLGQLRAEAAAVRQQLEQPAIDLAGGQARWEAEVGQQEKTWTVLPIESAAAQNGTVLAPQPDGSLLATAASPEQDTYTLTVRTPLAAITAIRIEALPDASLPGGGPGRAGGNFVLGEVRVQAAGAADVPKRGRFVRIELPGDHRILSLAEVQVFKGGENVAPRGKASQSSVDFGGAPERAIDGNTSGDYDRGSVTHTAHQANPWWEVDLGSAEPVERIVVWNRTGGALFERLKDARVSLLNDARQAVWQATLADPPKQNAELAVGGPTPVAIRRATADFEQDGFGVGKASDGDAATGWAIGPAVGRAHQAVLELAAPVGEGAATTIAITLVQTYGSGHTLGRLRLSATGTSPPPVALPAAVREALAAAAGERTAEQRTALAAHYRTLAPELAPLRAQLAAIESRSAEVQQQAPSTPIMVERPPDKRRATHVLIKSNFLQPGEQVEPGIPAAFHPWPAGAPPNRLGVALWLVHPDNPLVARVAVNRFWSQLWGRGLVESEEDFGTQGTPPTHPELLDYLAVQFVRGGWDVKALLRQIVTSAAYRQASSASEGLLERDPYNRLLARGPRHRLDAELVRDQALRLAGLLSDKQGGPSVYPPQPPGLWRAAFNGERTWATSAGEDRYRRGLYTYWRRTVPYPSMAAFDAPSREICALRRISTNTPLQAFVTLNDPVYVEAAQVLARRLLAAGGSDPASRAHFGLRLCLGRPPQDEQVAHLVSLYGDALAKYQADPAAATKLATEPAGALPAGVEPAEAAAWTVVANVLLNLDGVLTKR